MCHTGVGLTWAGPLDDWCAWLAAAGRSPRTVDLRRRYLARLATCHGDPWQVSVDDLTRFVGRPGWSPETRKSARASVVGFYRWAQLAGHLACSPAAALAPVSVPRGAPRPAPTDVLFRAVLRSTDRDVLVIMLAALAGLRRAEVAAVHARDLVDGHLRVVGKGGRVRVVPLHPDLDAAIRRELALRVRGRHGTGWRYRRHLAADGYLFPGLAGGHIGPDAVGRVLSRRLGGGWTGHTLRHRFASRAYAHERDLRAVQELLGHSKPETTARYTAVPTGALQAAVLAVGAA